LPTRGTYRSPHEGLVPNHCFRVNVNNRLKLCPQEAVVQHTLELALDRQWASWSYRHPLAGCSRTAYVRTVDLSLNAVVRGRLPVFDSDRACSPHDRASAPNAAGPRRFDVH
jgi:hypothetical protein